MFRKAKPDTSRFVDIPVSVYERLGGFEASELPVLMLSHLRGGTVVTGEKTVETPKGNVTISLGEVWTSLTTIKEDITAASGKRFTRGQVRGAMRFLKSEGLVEDLGMVLPETRGRYGKKYALPEYIVNIEGDSVDVMPAYQMFAYGKVEEFLYSEYLVTENIRTEDHLKRGRFNRTDKWREFVLENGHEKEAYSSLGAWRHDDMGRDGRPVFVPWIVVDIDRSVLYEALMDAETLVRAFKGMGISTDKMFVAFTGGRGFHIEISTAQFGCPIFADAEAARETIKQFVMNVSDDYGIEVDSTVFSPHNLIRLAGSTHRKTGRKKRVFLSQRVLDQTPDQNFKMFFEAESDQYDNAWASAVEEEAREYFVDSAHEAQRILTEAQINKRRGAQIGTTMKRILNGVAESEIWHERHVGRNKASYILACWIMESDSKKEQVANALGISSDMTDEELLLNWNKRNSPPLPYNEIRGTINSAQKTV